MKVALVYDRVNKWGGAERVLLHLHELFPDAPLYTSVYNKPNAEWADVFDVRPSYVQKLPFAAKSHEFYPVLMPSAFEQFTFDKYDLVISVTSEAAKGIITKPGTKHICYCLTPTRYLWSGYDEYFSNQLFRTISSPAVSYLRSWDRIAAQRPDVMIGISDEVKKRIKKYYNRNVPVIYPPFTKLRKDPGKEIQLPDDFFLIVSRLVPYKRVDIAIQACNTLSLPLFIVGSGSEEQHLRDIAGPTIQFTGNLTDGVLAEYYEKCRALIFPGEEDYGLTVIEAQSFGKPVIAYKKGGALETVREGSTGIFFKEPSAESLMQILKSFDPKLYNPNDARKQAEKFSADRFKKEFLELVNRA